VVATSSTRDVLDAIEQARKTEPVDHGPGLSVLRKTASSMIEATR
jgi:hypothetical protein